MPTALASDTQLRSVEPLERGGTIHGGQWAPFEKVSEKVSEMGINILMLHGDIVNFFKFLSPVALWNASVCIPGFDLFNGVSGTICGTAIASSGVKARRMAKQTGDRAGKAEANWTVEIGVSLVALSIFKLGYAGLGIANYIRALPGIVALLIQTFGMLNGIFTILAFLGFSVRAYHREKEVYKFRDEFRAVLLSVLQDSEVIGNALPEKGTPEELFKKAHEKSQMNNENGFSELVLAKLREKMRVGDKGATTKAEMVDEIREIIQCEEWGGRRGFKLDDYAWILVKDTYVMFDKAEELFTNLKKMDESDIQEYNDLKVRDLKVKIKKVRDLREKWSAKVNFENLVSRATKGDIITEICQGHPIDARREQNAHEVLKHLFAKWTSRRNWNRGIGVVAMVAVGIVIFLLTATSGPMTVIACGVVVGLFVVFAAFFDGRGVVGSLSVKKKKKNRVNGMGSSS